MSAAPPGMLPPPGLDAKPTNSLNEPPGLQPTAPVATPALSRNDGGGNGANGNDPNNRTYIEGEKRDHPGSMNSYERNWVYQLGMTLLLFAIAVGNTYINFEMIDVYEDLINQLKGLPDPNQVDDTIVDEMLVEFNQSVAANLQVCDIDYFDSVFVKDELINALETVQRFLKASAYITVGFGIWVTFLIKVLSAYSLVTEDFNIVPTEELMKSKRESYQEINGQRVSTPGHPKFDLIKTRAVAESRILESLGEKKIRVYLRSETILFGFNQVIQDIPQATGVMLYILFLTRTRGVLCYEGFTNGVVSETFGVDNVNLIALGQLVLILLSLFFNLVCNLAPRWVVYFRHQTIKHFRRPTSTSIRIFQVCMWVIGYLFAVFLPLFAVLYSPLGNDLLGVNTTNNLGLLVVLILSSLSLSVGMFIVCCFWGTQFGENFCVCAVVFEALALGVEPCCEIEGCSLVTDVCC